MYALLFTATTHMQYYLVRVPVVFRPNEHPILQYIPRQAKHISPLVAGAIRSSRAISHYSQPPRPLNVAQRHNRYPGRWL